MLLFYCQNKRKIFKEMLTMVTYSNYRLLSVDFARKSCELLTQLFTKQESNSPNTALNLL